MTVDLATLRALADQWPATITMRTVPVASPAVATDFAVTVSGGSLWLLQSLSARLVTDANAANRFAALTVTDGSTTLWSAVPAVAITAGLTTDIAWLPGLEYASSSIVGNKIAIGLPDMILPSGWTFGPVTSSIQAADQWSRIVATVIEIWSGDIEHLRNIQQNIVDKSTAIAELIRER